MGNFSSKIKEQDYSILLSTAEKKANSLNCNFGDFSQNNDKALIHYRERFKVNSLWELVFRNNLGEALQQFQKNESAQDINIIDIGCGDQNYIQTLKYMNFFNHTYLGIDIKSISTDSITGTFGCKEDKFVCADILNKDSLSLPDRKYDIIIIDVEPHGKEWNIYQKFLPYLSNIHLIILQCVGYIDGFGDYYAKNFLYQLNERNGLYNFLENVKTRDLYVVAKHNCDSKFNIENYADM